MTLLLPYEVWRGIKGYEGLYQISARGRVKRCERFLVKKVLKEIIKKTTLDGGGYPFVSLSKSGSKRSIKIHRLVGTHFIYNPKNKREVNHIDGNKENCCVSNLEWVTSSENQLHAYRTGLQKVSKYRSELVSKMFTGIKQTPEWIEKRISKIRGRKNHGFYNSRSIPVINTITGEKFRTMKMAWESDMNICSYDYFKQMVSERCTNKTHFKRIESYE